MPTKLLLTPPYHYDQLFRVFFVLELYRIKNTYDQVLGKGAFNNSVDRILPFFDPPFPLRGHFLYPECGRKQTFFDPLPSSQTHKLMAATKFSDYLGLKHYKKAKK